MAALDGFGLASDGIHLQVYSSGGAHGWHSVTVNRPPEAGRSGQGIRTPIAGRIDFSDVTFRYPGAVSPALDLDELKRGQEVLLNDALNIVDAFGYERVGEVVMLKEILEGDATLSIRGDEAEELWRIVEPVLSAWADNEVPLEEYRAGSAGPSGARVPEQAGADEKRGTAPGDDPNSG